MLYSSPELRHDLFFGSGLKKIKDISNYLINSERFSYGLLLLLIADESIDNRELIQDIVMNEKTRSNAIKRIS